MTHKRCDPVLTFVINSRGLKSCSKLSCVNNRGEVNRRRSTACQRKRQWFTHLMCVSELGGIYLTAGVFPSTCFYSHFQSEIKTRWKRQKSNKSDVMWLDRPPERPNLLKRNHQLWLKRRGNGNLSHVNAQTDRNVLFYHINMLFLDSSRAALQLYSLK